ncbi:peptidoglycan-binding protein [Chelativorans sp. AA-79]|uniref:peptidoglycan-binding domain-containing protein n=1 Tax=Chelativorans sp. AA-79 TaxID=3028735 RepID=UPI0023F855AB|nr:peptidoglycan-binding protein [Chelativorans sp. AA-79]WEX07745.1 peptidoglycan-binding domain-containing protein [Chelativorans sp. AA-79]
MTRYAKRPDAKRQNKRAGWLRAGISGVASATARNPVAVGGTTAFLVSLAFVSANAVFYQPQVHPNAFLSTRELGPRALPDAAPEHPHPRAAPRDVRQVDPLPDAGAGEEADPGSTGSVPVQADGDETVRSVQDVLSDLGLYRGPIDGMAGPQTNAAIETYRRVVGLDEGHQIDAALLNQLGLGSGGQSAPAPAEPGTDHGVQTASAEAGDATIRRIQAGLKAFGNDGIEIDGMMGARTEQAIREFQSLFGLPVTGEPDAVLVTKMKEIGLIN